MTLPSSTHPHQQLCSTNTVYHGYMHTPDASADRRPQLTPIPRLMGGSFKLHAQALDGYVDDPEASSNVSNPSMTSQALVRDVHTSDNFYLTSQEEWSQLSLKQSRQPFEDSRNPPPLANIAEDLTSETADFEAAAEGSDFRSDSLSIEPSSARSSVQAGSTEPSSLSYGTAMDGGYIPRNQAASTFYKYAKPVGRDLIQEDDDI
ncbi:hypothetical protein F4823DRAFT_330615 [Ustulina deusta]|nr:hypothetical protein F4823DRAFT_330615 [Ustulina deusta]